MGAPVTGNVAAAGAEGLGEGAHQEVHVGGVHALVLAQAAARGAQAPDAVRLVQVQVCLPEGRRPLGVYWWDEARRSRVQWQEAGRQLCGSRAADAGKPGILTYDKYSRGTACIQTAVPIASGVVC